MALAMKVGKIKVIFFNYFFPTFLYVVSTVMVMIICGGARVLLMCCVVEQHEGGANPTESMTRALISDDSIARQSTLGPVQLGYVSPPHFTNHIINIAHIFIHTFLKVFETSAKIAH